MASLVPPPGSTVLILGGLAQDEAKQLVPFLLAPNGPSPAFVRIVDKGLIIPSADVYTTYIDGDMRKALKEGTASGVVEYIQGNLNSEVTRNRALTLPDAHGGPFKSFDYVFDYTNSPSSSATATTTTTTAADLPLPPQPIERTLTPAFRLGQLAAQELNHTRRRSNTVAAFPGRGNLESTPFRPPFPTVQVQVPPTEEAEEEEVSGAYYPTPGAAGNGVRSAYGGGGHSANDSISSSSRLLYQTSTPIPIVNARGLSPSLTVGSSGTGTGPGGGPVGVVVGADTSSHEAFLHVARARAATIGVLDDSRETLMRKRAGTTVGLMGPPPGLGNGGMLWPDGGGEAGSGPQGGAVGGGPGVSGLTRGIRGLSVGQEDSPWGPPTMGGGSTVISRTVTPNLAALESTFDHHLNTSNNSNKIPTPSTLSLPQPRSHSLTPPLQIPTRSLWIGNLDPKTTSSELQSVFSPYGIIESLRLIPEKECGFVNFTTVGEATAAKGDVLNRIGTRLSKGNGMLRIGFGKAEAAAGALNGALGRGGGGLGGLGNNGGPINLTGGGGAGGGGSGGGGGGGGEGMGLQSAPTRALWVGSIPPSTTQGHLLAIFGQFGAIESARVLTHKSCGFVNFERIEDAVSARLALNGVEILGSEVGAVRIGFAKVPPKTTSSPDFSPGMGGGAFRPAGEQYSYDTRGGAGQFVGGTSNGAGGEEMQVPRETVTAPVAQLQAMMRELGEDGAENEEHVQALAAPRQVPLYSSVIPQAALADPAIARRYSNADAPRLREIRKRLDAVLTTSAEIDEIGLDLLPECIALASDYIGNTLIQKVFERASLHVRMALLDRLGPHLATIGTHKNGTWAVQKIVQCAQEPEECELIRHHLTPYTPPLLLNDFGNYVVQGALRFGSPVSDFIFDAMADHCWEIGSGRFGARSTRQTLESPLASAYQVKRVALSIALNSISLITNANGAILVTWLLDTATFPGRFALVAARFAPHLAQLCTHKIASVAVLKIMTQSQDMYSARLLLDALFDPERQVLERVLENQMHGIAWVTKLVSTLYVGSSELPAITERIKSALISLQALATPAYRRLMEDLGLPFQGPPAPPSPSTRFYHPGPSSPMQHAPMQQPQLGYQPQYQHEYGSFGYPSQYARPGPSAAAAYQFYAPPNIQYQRLGGIDSPTHPLSPLLAPLPVSGSNQSDSLSPVLLPAGIPPISSPDPFFTLRVDSRDPSSGFHLGYVSPPPQTQPYSYYRPQQNNFNPSPSGQHPSSYAEYIMGNGGPLHDRGQR